MQERRLEDLLVSRIGATLPQKFDGEGGSLRWPRRVTAEDISRPIIIMPAHVAHWGSREERRWEVGGGPYAASKARVKAGKAGVCQDPRWYVPRYVLYNALDLPLDKLT